MDTARLSAEALMSLRPVSSPVLTTTGDALAFLVSGASPRPGERRTSTLWYAETGKSPIALVDEQQANAGAPAFSRDGTQLAFALSRDGELPDAWIREPSGEVRLLASCEGAVEALSWSADGTHLLVLVADPGSDNQGAGAGTRMVGGQQEPIVRRPREAWRRLWRFDVASSEAIPLTPDGVNVWEFDWAGSGPVIAVVSAQPTESAWYDATIAAIDSVTGSVTQLHEPQWQLQSPAVDHRGRQAAFVEGFASDRTCVTGTVTVIDLATGKTTELAPEIDVAQIRWLADGSLFYTAIVGLDTSCGRLAASGVITELWRGPAMMGLSGPRAAVSADGNTVVAPMDAPGMPHEVRELDLKTGDWIARTDFNSELAGFDVPESSRVAWTAPDGLEIEGILVQPPGHTDGPLPLVVVIHGGPVGAHGFGFLRPTELALANAGYALLLPNPRGSAGRGQAFAQGVRHDMGGAELTDTLAGIEHLRTAGSIDGDRVGITGFSHGGFISAWAPTQTDVFRAAVPRGCVANWISFHNTSNIGRWDELFLGSDPYDPTGHHFTRSPVVHSRGCKTPTLVMHGELDLSAPVGQARELYQALVDVGCETELVIYPRAGHGWQEREQLLDSCERMIKWFDKHLAP